MENREIVYARSYKKRTDTKKSFKCGASSHVRINVLYLAKRITNVARKTILQTSGDKILYNEEKDYSDD